MFNKLLKKKKCNWGTVVCQGLLPWHCSFLNHPCISGINPSCSWCISPEFWEIFTKEIQFSSVHFSRSVVSDSLRPHESQHARPPYPSPTPRVHPDSRPSSQWCHPAISSSVVPFSSCPQSFPASDFVSITSHIHSWVLFLLWLHPFFLSGIISPLISSSILDTYWPGEFIFQCKF